MKKMASSSLVFVVVLLVGMCAAGFDKSSERKSSNGISQSIVGDNLVSRRILSAAQKIPVPKVLKKKSQSQNAVKSSTILADSIQKQEDHRPTINTAESEDDIDAPKLYCQNPPWIFRGNIIPIDLFNPVHHNKNKIPE